LLSDFIISWFLEKRKSKFSAIGKMFVIRVSSRLPIFGGYGSITLLVPNFSNAKASGVNMCNNHRFISYLVIAYAFKVIFL